MNTNINTKITFVKPSEDMIYCPKKKLGTYYQICKFKNVYTKKYETRKVIFNEKGEILKIYEREYPYKILKNFIKHHRKNKYQIYNTHSIELIDLPNGADFVCCQSDLLNGDNCEYDYCKFEEEN